jgi:hypothetical protein
MVKAASTEMSLWVIVCADAGAASRHTAASVACAVRFDMAILPDDAAFLPAAASGLTPAGVVIIRATVVAPDTAAIQVSIMKCLRRRNAGAASLLSSREGGI